MTKKVEAKGAIPAFANHEEEAAFWDTHDIGDYWDATEPVDVEFSDQLSENLTVRLSQATVEKLRRQAELEGVAPSTLARMWLVERLREADATSAQRKS